MRSTEIIIWIIDKNSGIFIYFFYLFLFMDKRRNYEVEKTHDNHCPEISGKAGDGKFRHKMDHQPDKKDVYNNCEKPQSDENERAEDQF